MKSEKDGCCTDKIQTVTVNAGSNGEIRVS